MYITGIDPSQWHTTAKNALGAIGLIITSQGAKQYKYVKLRNESATVDLDNGDMVSYLDQPANDEEINTVVSDYTDSGTRPVGAGAAEGDGSGNFSLDGVQVSSIAGTANTAYYGWVQQTGYFVSNQAIGGTVTEGEALICGGGDKALTIATAVDNPVCAICINDAAQTARLCCI